MTPASCRNRLEISLLLVIAGLMTGCTAGPTPAGVAAATAATSQCPQARETQRAPDTYQALRNPLDPNDEHLAQGRTLYEAEREGYSCASCHGVEGGGRGPDGAVLMPPPRDFTCTATMQTLTDGQLFWIIQNGSGAYHQPARQGAQQVPRPGRREAPTAMTAYGRQLSEAEIWQLVLYIRSLAPAGVN
jgi:mono/diheme cytochrome c family protein